MFIFLLQWHWNVKQVASKSLKPKMWRKFGIKMRPKLTSKCNPAKQYPQIKIWILSNMSKKITLPVFGEKLTKLSENPHVVVCGGVGGERSFDLCRKHFFCLTFHTWSIGGCEKSCFLTGMPSWPGLSGLGGRRQEKCDTGTLGEETTYKKTKCEKSFLQIFLVLLSRTLFW